MNLISESKSFLSTALGPKQRGSWSPMFVYHFTDYMDTSCGQSIFLDENIAQIKLYLTRSSHYNPNMQCTLNIYTINFNTSVTERIMFYFNVRAAH